MLVHSLVLCYKQDACSTSSECRIIMRNTINFYSRLTLNEIGDEGVMYISDVLKGNTCLHQLV